MAWVKQTQDKMMPGWLQDSLPAYCSCGAEKENYYNDYGECTNRRCPNPSCPETLAKRIAWMCDYMGVAGIKEGRGLQMVREYGLRTHYDAIPRIFSEEPEIWLGDFMRISFIPGIDSQWLNICERFATLEELREGCTPKIRDILDGHWEALLYGYQFVKIKPIEKQEFKTILTGNVMMSGNIRGFHTRENFIAGMNASARGLLDLRVVGKRKTNVMCLIQEADEPNRGKAECAIENGIPIMTPKEFEAFIVSKLQERLKGGA